MIGVIDYGAGNLQSLSNALEALELKFRLIHSPVEVHKVDELLVPGVGSYRSAVIRLHESGMFDEIVSFGINGGKITGICLGMQLLFDQSEEGGATSGFGLIPGNVVASRTAGSVQVNRIGWDTVHVKSQLDLSGDYFFAHSFEAVGVPEEHVMGVADSGGRQVVSIVQRGRVIGIQFHPEKSGTRGLQSLRWALGAV